MSEKSLKYTRLVIGCILSLAVIAAGVMLAVSCVSIYRLGERPFTVANISSAFSRIDLPIYICLGTVIVGAVAWLFLPIERIKLRAVPDKRASIERTEGKIDLDTCDSEILDALRVAKKKRLVLRIVAIALCVAFSIPMLVVSLMPASYTSDYNQSVASLFLFMLPCLALMLAVGITYSYLEAILLDRHLNAAKAALTKAKTSGNVKEYVKKDCGCQKKAVITRCIVLAITIALLVMGIVGGGMTDVLSKAVNICTECIGLG